MMCVRLVAFGNGVSMAEAKGWTRSGHSGSNSHSAVAHRLQKWRSAGLVASDKDNPVLRPPHLLLSGGGEG